MIGTVNSGSGGTLIVIQTTAPDDTSVLWINPSNNTLSYYYNGAWKKITGVYA